jgi:CRISPR-associated exonuclease Cas4
MNESEYIPIAALNHYGYCSHRCWRMFCAGEFMENQYTIEGTSLHDRVHRMSETNREDTWQVRAIWLKSDQYQLIGKSDLIESANGQLYPVEYKRGKRGYEGYEKPGFYARFGTPTDMAGRNPVSEWDNDALQVVGQALCLEEMTGKKVDQGFVYYAQSHQRVAVEISAEMRQRAIAIISEIHRLLKTGTMPPPVYSKRCRGCSLYSQCLPQAAKKVSRYCE